MIELDKMIKFLTETGILYTSDDTSAYSSDASFLTLGLPGLIIFPKTEDEVLKVVDFAAKNKIPLTPRAKGSSTAGASLTPDSGVIIMTDRLGVTDKFGKRLGGLSIQTFKADGGEFALRHRMASARGGCEREEEIYARVGSGVTTEELDKYLAKYGWQTAVVPSSGWSTIGGNFCTNAGGNGTPKYGTYKDVINRLKVITTTNSGAETKTIIDREKIISLGGNQGLYGIVTELDVRIVPRLTEEEMLSVVCATTIKDVEELGDVVGEFMVEMEKVCSPTIAEFMMSDKGIFKKDDPLLKNEEIKDFFEYPEGSYKFLTMYQGKKEELSKLKSVSDRFGQIEYKEISAKAFKIMLELRKAATGKSPGRVAIPGFEDIYVKDPKYLGKVLKAIYSITEGSLPGRPIGHQYTGGLVIHYRPLASGTKAEYQKAWDLTQSLSSEVFKDEYQTVKRREHGLGLEVYKLATPEERRSIDSLKKEFDPAGIFQPHLITENPTIKFMGDQLIELD